ncbi:hypothetical protein K504DRAFT_499742 [Pleomassaria siparia CBS 279.74]|uniref:Uncharacterized protein n=1 Tax=Pleomassaria siparia CBS 279.74 TaxID=1314801 RepID=A0A6G1KII9_9PLEO|nr:hypothetical protein K504DRAFT_499742 [Pleomassaria siparia CBS 279.74]
MEGADITYATAKDWEDIMKNRSSLRMHALIQRLGLRAKWSSNKRGKTNFENPSVKALVSDMGDIVSGLPKDNEELVRYLASPESLRKEVEELMHKHGSAIWGRMSSREHLLTADSSDVDTRLFYPRNLYYEQEDDRAMIQMLLHWWIGLKACNVILARERLDRERRKKEYDRKAMVDRDSPREMAALTFVSLAPTPDAPTTASTPEGSKSLPLPPATQASRHAQAFRFDASSRGSSMSPAVQTPASSESPTMHARSILQGNGIHYLSRDANGTTGTSAVPLAAKGGLVSNHAIKRETNGHYTSSQPDLRKLNLELGNLVSNFLLEDGPQERASPITPQSAPGETARYGGGVYRGLDADTYRALRAYVYAETSEVQPDEERLLRRLETAWREGVRTSRNLILPSTPLFIAMDRTFLTWIEIRRHLSDLERADKRWCDEGNSDHEIAARVQQHRTLMSASREMIRNWYDIAEGLNFVNMSMMSMSASASASPNASASASASASADQNASATGMMSAAKPSADEVLVQALVLLAGESNTPDTTWVIPNVEGIIRWLAENVQRFSSSEEDNGHLLYVAGT